MKPFIYILALLLAVSPAMAQEPAPEPVTPPSSSWVASMKIDGATFWLRYTGTTDEQVKKTEDALKMAQQTGGTGSDAPGAIVWLTRVKAARNSRLPPMQLGQVELSAEGNVKAAARKIETYAEAESGEHMYLLGHLYFHGLGVPKDMKRGYFWLDRARHAGPHPWVTFYIPQDLDAAAAAIAAADGKSGENQGGEKKVDFRMPGEPGAPGPAPVGGPSLRMDSAPEPAAEAEANGMAMPAFEEGLTLYPPPYPEE